MSNPSSFGHPDRYYASGKKSRRDEETLFDFARADREIRKALEKRYETFHESVERTVKSWNVQLRDSIRQETGLRLSGGNDRQGLSVHVVDGLPRPLAAVFDDVSTPLIWELILNNATLKKTLTGLDVLSGNFELLSEWRKEIESQTTIGEIQNTKKLVAKLVAWVDSLSISERLKQIDEDILGAYFFRERTIRIYWMAIGLISRMLDVSLEGLTITVLTHELVHAYTHLGNDIDNENWETEPFANADLKIVEGLAQYYTATICKKLDGRAPGLWSAFERLLTVQSPTYTEFKSWTESNQRAGEVIRFSLIGCRKKKLANYKDFLAEMKKVRERVGSGDPDQQGT